MNYIIFCHLFFLYQYHCPVLFQKTPVSSIKKQVRVISGPKSRKTSEPKEARPWGWKNQVGKRFTAQSKRDPHYGDNKEEKIVRTQARREHLLKQVQPNWLTFGLPSHKQLQSQSMAASWRSAVLSHSGFGTKVLLMMDKDQA